MLICGLATRIKVTFDLICFDCSVVSHVQCCRNFRGLSTSVQENSTVTRVIFCAFAEHQIFSVGKTCKRLAAANARSRQILTYHQHLDCLHLAVDSKPINKAILAINLCLPALRCCPWSTDLYVILY